MEIKRFISIAFFSRDRRLSEEQRLRQQLERELSEKSEELLREKSRSLRSSAERKPREGRSYSPLDYSLDYGGTSSYYNTDELEASKALNFQVKII